MDVPTAIEPMAIAGAVAPATVRRTPGIVTDW